MSKYEITAQFNVQAKPGSAKRAIDQIKREIKSPKINLEVANGAKAAKDIKGVANATKNLAKEAKATESNIASMSKMFGSALKNVLRYDIARRVFYGFAGAVEQGVKDAISFEREMVKIAQVSGQTMQQLKGLEKTVGGLATNLGVSSSSLIKVGLILKQTGLSVKDTQIAMQALAKTELAPTFDNIADTAETAVAAMRQFGLEASALEGLLGKINTVAANFAVEASDIGVAIKRAGGAFKAAGGEVEELIALFTSVRATTRETAETIATGFRTIFTRLQRPTTIKFLRQFGIELTDLNGKFVGPYEAVLKLNNALANLDSTDLRFSAIVEQLGGFRQVSKVIPLLQQGATTQAAYNAQLKATDSLSRDAQTAQQALAVQMAKVTEEVKELFREVADSSTFQALAGTALSFARALTAVGKAIAPIIPMVTALFAIRGGAFLGGALKKGGLGGLSSALGRTDGRNNLELFGGGGKVHKFNRGGWVPGTGNSDTVPAMLQPGEFVIRKSAAQAFGSSLNGINKYAGGGKVSYTGDDLSGGASSDITRRIVKDRTKEVVENLHGRPSMQKQKFNAADQISANIGITKVPYTIGITKKGKKIGDPTATGERWEKHVQKYLGIKKRHKGANYPIDFVKANGVYEAKKGPYWTDKESFDKLLRHRIMSKTLTGKWTAEKNKGDIGKLNMMVPGKKTIKKMAKGGGVGSDTVPALLTPGEFVINKQSAQSIGYGNLANMNRYNTGGKVAALGAAASSGVGSGLMDAVLITSFISSITNFVQQAGFLSDEMGAVVTEFGGTLGQIKGINSTLASFSEDARKRKEFGFFKSGQKAGERLGEIGGRLEKRRGDADTFKGNLESLRAEQKSVQAMKDAGETVPFDKLTRNYDEEIATQDKLRKNNQRRINAYEKESAQQQKTLRTAKAFTFALEAAATVAVQFGDYLADSAKKAIAAGDFEGRSAQAAAGGGLSAGVQGAMAGFMVGGKKGGIWGGIIAAVGGATLAFINAEKQIKQVKFAQTLEDGKKDLELFQKQAISAGEGLQNLERKINKRKALAGDMEESDRAGARAAQEAAASAFVTGLGKNVASVEEFDKSINKNSQTLRSVGAIEDKLINKIRDEIKERLNSEQKLREYTEAQREATNELLRLKGISAITTELKSDIATFGNVISGVGTSGIGPIGKAGGIFDQKVRSKSGIQRFNQSIDAIGQSGRSAGLNEFTGRVKASASVERNIDEVLSRVGRINPVGADNIEDAILKDLKDSIGPEAAKVVGADLDKALRGIDVVNLDDQADEIKEAINKVIGASTETFKEFSGLIDERNSFLKSANNQLISIENSYIASLRKARDSRVKAEQNYLSNINVSPMGAESDAAVQARFFGKLSSLANPGKGIKGTDVPVDDIGALGKRLLELQKEQVKVNRELAQPNNADLAEQENLINSAKSLKNEFDIVKSILNEYGNSQQRLIRLNEDLARAQEREKTLKDAADSIIFGTASESNEAAKLVNSVTKALSEGTVMGIAPELRMAVVDIFKSGQFGQQGVDILNKDRAARMGQSGVANANILAEPSKAVKDAANEIRTIEEQAAAAFDALAQVDGQRVDQMASAIETQNNKFLKRLESLFREERIRQTEADQKTQKSIVDGLGKTKSMIEKGGIGDKEFAALKSPDRMKDVDTLRKLQGRKTQNLRAAAFSDYSSVEIEDFLDDYKMKFVKGMGAMPATASGGVQTSIATDYMPALDAVRGVMEATGLKNLRTRAMTNTFDPITETYDRSSRATELGESGLLGADVIPNLMKYAGENFSESAATKFNERIKTILGDTDQYASVGVQEIAKAMKIAQDSTQAAQAQLEKDPAIKQLAKLDKSFTDELSLRLTGIKNIKTLNSQYEEATTTLQRVTEKLNNITGGDITPRQASQARGDATAFMENLRLKADNSISTSNAAGIKNFQEFVGSGGKEEAQRTKELIKGYEQTLKTDPNNNQAAAMLAQTKVYLEGLYKEGVQKGNSIAVHDNHAVPVLQEILLVLKGQGQTGAAGAGGSTTNFTQVDTTGLDASINNFSSAVSDLERIMSGPIKMEVGGELNVNVNLTGAEVLQESEAAFAQMAGRKVTEGINNFIRDGLRNSSIAIKGDWTA